MGRCLEIRNLKVSHRTFEGVREVLDIDELAIEKGQAYGLVGESGSGKTVLALTILRLLATPPGRIEGGEILLDGEDLLRRSERQMGAVRGRKIAAIFQDPMSSLNPVLTVGYQMRQVIQRNRGSSAREAQRFAVEMIGKVKLPDAGDILRKYPHELSGGQRQRIIIAMALSCGAGLIIADEPTRNLDVTIQAGILKLIKQLQEELGVTVLFIANNLGLVSAVCDEIGILQRGRIVERGPVRRLLDSPQHEYTKLLLWAARPGRKAAEDGGAEGEVLLEATGLKKYFPVKNEFITRSNLTVKAVDGVSLDIRRGEVLGIVGESGCGKSTLVNTILLLHPPTEGRVVFDGLDVFALGRERLRQARQHIQIVFQDPFWSLNPRWQVKQIIGEPLRVHEELDAGRQLARVQDLMEMVGLPRDGVFRYPHEFSGGQRQRIAIARALSVNPKLVVLDEPTSSIDVMSQAQLLELLTELKGSLKLTYILISHDLGVVNYMADRIAVMYLGKVVEFGRARAVFGEPKHPYTRALFNAIPNLQTRGIRDLATLEGDVPSAIFPPAGCRFHPRCERCLPVCGQREPPTAELGDRTVACHLYG